MVVSDLSIQRPVLAFVLSAILLVLGMLGYQRLPVRELPQIDTPVVSINTNYPGASAEVVDNEITEKIERAVNGINGIKTIRSRSAEGNSNVNIEFEINRDVETAANDVRDRVARVLPQLPETVDPPQVQKVDSDAQPIVFVSLISDRMSKMELNDYALRYLVDRFNTVDGVAQVSLPGGHQYSMRVWLDRNAMAAHGITVADVERAIQRENAELPAGRIESAAREFTVRTDTRLVTSQQFAAIVLKQEGEAMVHVGDVAKVEVAPRDVRGDFMIDGKPGNTMGLGMSRQSTANTLDVAAGIHRLVDQVRPTLPAGTRLEYMVDDSTFIRQSIEEVFIAIGFAVMLVMAVIWVFLRTLRATLIPVVAIPVSLISAMAVLAVLGYSLNVLTLLAFVLAVGLVVDDAIVVVENASRRIEEGEPPLLAAYRGARQIGFAVIATTLVLVSVVMPLAVLEGSQGRLFREFAIALVAAIAFSCLVALTLSPMLCSKILGASRSHGRIFEASERAFRTINETYARWLDRALSRPSLVLAVLAAAVVLSVAMFLTRPQELAPTEDRGQMRIFVSAPEGATLDYTKREVAEANRILQPYLDSGVISNTFSMLNPGFGGGGGVNRGQVMSRLAPWGDRDVSAQDFLAKVRGRLMAIPGARIIPSLPTAFGGAFGSAANQVQFVLGGDTFEELVTWRDAIFERLQRPGTGLVGLQANYDETKPQLRILVDRPRAADLGVSVADIGATLETMMGGRKVTRYLERGEEYDVVLQAADRDRSSPRDLSNIYVRGTKSPQLIPLANLIRVIDAAGATELNRFNRQRAVMITANLTEGTTIGDAIDAVRAGVADVLPPEAHLSFDGIARQQLESSQSILFAFGLALLAAFLVLAGQFENFVLPGMILAAAPLAMFGGLLAITLTGMSINIYTEIGLIMLIGLISKNAILIVEFANQLRDEGRDLDQAIRAAAMIRLRPILMTSIATVFGSVPLAMATGAGAESRQAIGWVIVGGVTVGTALSLFVTPVLYRLLARNIQPIGTVRRTLRRLESQHRGAEAAAE